MPAELNLHLTPPPGNHTILNTESPNFGVENPQTAGVVYVGRSSDLVSLDFGPTYSNNDITKEMDPWINGQSFSNSGQDSNLFPEMDLFQSLNRSFG